LGEAEDVSRLGSGGDVGLVFFRREKKRLSRVGALVEDEMYQMWEKKTGHLKEALIREKGEWV